MSASEFRRQAGIATSAVGQCANRAALIALVALRVVLAPLAEASPPDLTWIAGIYDEGDFDDVVTQVGSLASICDWAIAPTLFRYSCGSVATPGLLAPGRESRIARHDRAPPLL